MPASLSSLQQTLQSFGDISRFLREGVADEDSRQLRDSLGALSMHIDALPQRLSGWQRVRAWFGRLRR
ncbi:MAG: hypothetical protein B7X79_07210 [Acidovorax sp. 17-64-282]|nr:MAG: hypothetical protein B7X79_07210 [Acidovorax sp. 17-64-282]